MLPVGWRWERLRREHPRRSFRSGDAAVDAWLATKALQNQGKHLSTTRLLRDDANGIAGYYTIAMGQVGFGELPPEMVSRLPRRPLPVAVLAWLGVSIAHQGKGVGKRLLAQALQDCHEGSRTFPFVAVVLDCVNDQAKTFYQHHDFLAMPGHTHKLFLSAAQLAAMITEQP